MYPHIDGYKASIDNAYDEIIKAQALGLNMNSSLTDLHQATSKHTEVLNRVLAKVPEQAKSAIKHSIEVSQRGTRKLWRIYQSTKRSRKNKHEK